MPMAQVNGVDINYELEGDGPETIVLINGLADDLTTWYGQMEDFLGAGYRVLRFDNRGIGKSSRPKGLYTTAMMAADAKALVDHLKLRDFHLVGVSMGGMISQLFAGTHPNRVASLTSIMSGTLNPRVGGPSPRVTVPLFLNRAKANTRDEIIKRSVDMFSLIKTEGDDIGDIEKKLETAFDRSYYPAGVRRQLAAIIATGDLRPHLKKITAPTLVIHGSKDPLAPLEGGKDSARNIKGAKLEIIEGMAHDLPKKFLPRITALIVDHAKFAEKAAAKLAA